MEPRLNIEQASPEAYTAMLTLTGIAAHVKLTPIQKELIKIRASQINGCAFCIDMHTKTALKIGETPQRLFLLNAWRETDLFTPAEKALLALVEEVTLIHRHGVSDAVYAEAVEHFGAERIPLIMMAIVTINAWNRISVMSRTQVPV